MELYEIQLTLKSPFITPWQSDIIFGHMAWSYRELYGEQQLIQWLEEFNEGHPPFVFSNGYITNSFPRPLLPPPNRNFVSKHEKIDGIRKGKQLKNLKFISPDDFVRLIKGEEIMFQDMVKGDFQSRVETHNIIDRTSGTSLRSDGLFELETTSLKDTDQLSIFTRIRDSEALQLLKDLLQLISYSGYGKKKSTGFGQFEVKTVIPRHDLVFNDHDINGVVWLSHGIPSRHDPISGWYKLETKYGKVGGDFEGLNSIYKKPMTRITPGSVFKTDNPKPFYGRMVKGILSNQHNVVQYGFALAIPIRLPQHL